jgi:hypothetical protein
VPEKLEPVKLRPSKDVEVHAGGPKQPVVSPSKETPETSSSFALVKLCGAIRMMMTKRLSVAVVTKGL